MHHRYGRRFAALLVAAVAAVAVAVPTAGASDQLSNKLTVGAVLIEQPPGQAWAIDLHLKADLIDAVDMHELPPSTLYTFQFPKAKLNASKFPACKTDEKQLRAKGTAACPSGSQIGKGTATAFGLGIQFDNVPVTIFNGPGSDSNRTVYVYSRLQKGGIDEPVPIVGSIKKTGSGFTAEFPIPDIKLSEVSSAAVQGFDTLVGKHIKVKGKKVSYLEAPTVCKGGFKFTYTAKFKNGASVTDSKTIPCEIPGV